MSTRVTILGCGGSLGVPMVGNDWLACDPHDPLNRRTRASIMIEHDGNVLVVDTGQDFREQSISNKINKIDAVLYTHYHADHTAGIDDLRGWCRRRDIKMPIYMSAETHTQLDIRYNYLIGRQHDELYPIQLNAYEIAPDNMYKTIRLGGVPVTVFEQDHGTCISLGVRIGDFAYSTDFVRLDARAVQTLKGVKNWVADGAAYHQENNRVHANLQTVYDLNAKIGAEQCYITHMPGTMDYKNLCRELPHGYAPAYDGLKIQVTV